MRLATDPSTSYWATFERPSGACPAKHREESEIRRKIVVVWFAANETRAAPRMGRPALEGVTGFRVRVCPPSWVNAPASDRVRVARSAPPPVSHPHQSEHHQGQQGHPAGAAEAEDAATARAVAAAR